MKFRKIICIFTAVALFICCLPVYSSAEETVTADYVEDEVVFEYNPAASSGKTLRAPSNFSSKLTDLGITELRRLPDYDSDIVGTASLTVSEPIVYVAKINGDVEETCRELKKLSGVTYAEPNYILETCGYSMPLEVKNQTKNYSTHEKWYLETMMNFPTAWEKYQTCGEGVTVAVIDNGFYVDATDFPVNLWDDGNGNHGWNTADNSADISPVYVNNSSLNDSVHGSNVAGIIGMSSNGSNFVGAAFGADLMLIKVANGQATSKNTTMITADAVALGIDYARVHGADVISISLGIGSYPNIIKNAVDNAYNAGIVIVASAGNSSVGSSVSRFYPAAADNVIGVMATDKTNTATLASFSNYDENNGEYYNIAAPGVQIVGCGIEKGKFSALSGTSQATPLVASCAALYLSVYPDRSPEDVYNSIKKSSSKTVISNSDVNKISTYRYPLLDAVEILDYGAIKPEINFDLTTTVIHDPSTGYLYGLDEEFSDISKYVTVTEGTGTAEFVPTALGNGTGSILNIYTLSGELYKSFTVILFGDVNGDCKIDGQDSVIIKCMINGMANYSDCVRYAADIDFDGEIKDLDSESVLLSGVGLYSVSQIR